MDDGEHGFVLVKQEAAQLDAGGGKLQVQGEQRHAFVELLFVPPLTLPNFRRNVNSDKYEGKRHVNNLLGYRLLLSTPRYAT